MEVDFGRITKYNPVDGTGLIDHTLSLSAELPKAAKFNSSQVKDKELANRLKIGTYRNKWVWYTYNSISSEDLINTLGTMGTDLPPSIQAQYVIELEKYWLQHINAKPNWLDSVTKNLCGLEFHEQITTICEKLHTTVLDNTNPMPKVETVQKKKTGDGFWHSEGQELKGSILQADREYPKQYQVWQYEKEEKKKQEDIGKVNAQLKLEKRKAGIKQFCDDRNITHLVHFTRASNLQSILQEGLLSREYLEIQPGSHNSLFNDDNRIDGCKNAICTSISFPNQKMFYILQNTIKEDWAVLLLDTSILWEMDCAFCQENAASNNERFRKIEDRKTLDALLSLFSENHRYTRAQMRTPSEYPTNPQAEVLVFNPIPPQYIKEIHFKDPRKLNLWNRRIQRNNNRFILVSNEFFFGNRCDHKFWY